MERLGQTNPDKVIDLLCERLAAERSAVKLYDAILRKVKASRHTQLKKFARELQEHRDQEEAHGEWCEEQIRALGGDPDEKTEKALLFETESQGLEQVIFSDAPLSQMFHALNMAELSDNAGWAQLIGLAEQAGDEDAKSELEERLQHEEDHLKLTHKIVGMFLRAEVMEGEEAQ
ncbi:MAG: ferritin-like domain-containing protein [Planctomycetes bacterium]|nr:ferritin-like domain-containing protein [Planctomycetota bacterium]